MNLNNAALKTALNLATGALFELDDAGVLVTRIEVENGVPVIDIDRAPPSVLNVRPAFCITRTERGTRRSQHTAFLRGCRLCWSTVMGAAA